MPRKGTKLSPEAAANQVAAIAAYHAEHYEKLSVGLKKGKRDAYKRLAAARGESVSGMIQALMDAEYRREFGEDPL